MRVTCELGMAAQGLQWERTNSGMHQSLSPPSRQDAADRTTRSLQGANAKQKNKNMLNQAGANVQPGGSLQASGPPLDQVVILQYVLLNSTTRAIPRAPTSSP